MLFGFQAKQYRKSRFGDIPYGANFRRKGQPGRIASPLGANLLAKKLRNLRTGVKQGDFRFPYEETCKLWRERPKRTRDPFMPYRLARAILATWRLAPNRTYRTLGANNFLQKRHVGSESGWAIYAEWGKKFWELWRQVLFWALFSKLLVAKSAGFSGLRTRVP